MKNKLNEYYNYYTTLRNGEADDYQNFAEWLADECRNNAITYADIIGDERCDDIERRVASLVKAYLNI